MGTIGSIGLKFTADASELTASVAAADQRVKVFVNSTVNSFSRVTPAVVNSGQSLRAFSSLAKEVGLQTGLFEGETYRLSRALSESATQFTKVREATVASGAATAGFAGSMTALKASLAAITPVTAIIVGGIYAITKAYELSKSAADKAVDAQVEAFERSGAAAAARTKQIHEETKAQQDVMQALTDAQRALAAYTSGGQHALEIENDKKAALGETLTWYKKTQEVTDTTTLATARLDSRFIEHLAIIERTQAAVRGLALAQTLATAPVKELASVVVSEFVVTSETLARLGDAAVARIVANVQKTVELFNTQAEAAKDLADSFKEAAAAESKRVSTGDPFEADRNSDWFRQYKADAAEAADFTRNVFLAALDAVGQQMGKMGGILQSTVAGAQSGGAGGAFVGLATGILSSSIRDYKEQEDAIRAAGEAVRQMNKDLADWRDSIALAGNSTAQATAEVERHFQDTLKQIDEDRKAAVKARGIPAGYDPVFAQQIAEANRLRREEIDLIIHQRAAQVGLNNAKKVQDDLELQLELARAQHNDALADSIELQIRLRGATDNYSAGVILQIAALDAFWKKAEEEAKHQIDVENTDWWRDPFRPTPPGRTPVTPTVPTLPDLPTQTFGSGGGGGSTFTPPLPTSSVMGTATVMQFDRHLGMMGTLISISRRIDRNTARMASRGVVFEDIVNDIPTSDYLAGNAVVAG